MDHLAREVDVDGTACVTVQQIRAADVVLVQVLRQRARDLEVLELVPTIDLLGDDEVAHAVLDQDGRLMLRRLCAAEGELAVLQHRVSGAQQVHQAAAAEVVGVLVRDLETRSTRRP